MADPTTVPPWRWLDPAPIGDQPTRCRTRCADPLDTVHRCTKPLNHRAGHEWATERATGGGDLHG
ncbi:hypothetical protein GCM10011608_10450 [Micromonospora sonchi]|uniref:Uncharacterized protein n=1 Tax=Micromonospora sonchi TaxID=1763543 RepID=A0A917TLH7_9ACTN|nr:hypothetical protein [Micromonospora sonchi]GGM27554.1 hypothetical protein GCM10011608_10450 [Micromonospora sonchi]